MGIPADHPLGLDFDFAVAINAVLQEKSTASDSVDAEDLDNFEVRE